ncbi:MAG: Tol-Pal system beta propeller repeat protein TolB, partial [Desulfobacterales bacterium]
MVKRSQYSFRAAMVFFLLLLPLPAAAAGQYDYIDIDSPFSRKIPIAIPAFSALSPEGTDAALLQKATDTLSRSLDFTGFFNIIDRGAYLIDATKTVMTVDQINFRNWTTIG